MMTRRVVVYVAGTVVVIVVLFVLTLFAPRSKVVLPLSVLAIAIVRRYVRSRRTSGAQSDD
jgi:membrane protein implicated in regulation of membrane protease activity